MSAVADTIENAPVDERPYDPRFDGPAEPSSDEPQAPTSGAKIDPRFASTASGRMFRGDPVLAEYVGRRQDSLPESERGKLHGRAQNCYQVLFQNGDPRMFWASTPKERELAIELIRADFLADPLMRFFGLTAQDVASSPQDGFRERGY